MARRIGLFVVLTLWVFIVWAMVTANNRRQGPRAWTELREDRRTLPDLSPAHRLQDAPRGNLSTIVKANNSLAVDLYARLRNRPGNLLIAPACITAGLGMIHAGARGETAAEIAHVLHDGNGDDLALGSPAMVKLVDTLNANGETREFVGAPAVPSYQVRLANALWVQSGYSIRAEYLALLKDLFDVEDVRVDFRRDRVRASQKINDWSSTKTGGRISRLIDSRDLPQDTKLVLTSALYLRASWHKPFLHQLTQDGSFRVRQTKWITVRMMHDHSYAEDFQYWENDDLQMLQIALHSGEFSMVVLLPKRWNGLTDIEESLTPESLEARIKAMRAPEEIDVMLPKFMIAMQISLKGVLSSLGMSRAFEDVADFSGINGKANDLFLFDAVHATTIEVNEEGIEAAASLGYISPDAFGGEPVTFHADHPFLFLIRDNRSGCILFLGRLTDPFSEAVGERP